MTTYITHKNSVGCILFSHPITNMTNIKEIINEDILPFFQVGDIITLEEE